MCSQEKKLKRFFSAGILRRTVSCFTVFSAGAIYGTRCTVDAEERYWSDMQVRKTNFKNGLECQSWKLSSSAWQH